MSDAHLHALLKATGGGEPDACQWGKCEDYADVVVDGEKLCLHHAGETIAGAETAEERLELLSEARSLDSLSLGSFDKELLILEAARAMEAARA